MEKYKSKKKLEQEELAKQIAEWKSNGGKIEKLSTPKQNVHTWPKVTK